MKFSSKEIENALSRMRYTLNGWNSTHNSVDITLTLVEANPGQSIMMDCLKITGHAPPDKDNPEKVVSMVVEIFPVAENLQPRVTKIESFPLKDGY